MQTILRNAFTRLNSRDFRRRAVRGILSRLFRLADSVLVKPGMLAAENVHRILILRPNHRLGNIVLLTPLIAEIERTFPGAEVDMLAAGDAAHDVLATFFCVRHIYSLPHYIVRHLIDVARKILILRRAHYDLVIDPSADSNSNRLLIAWIKPRYAIGVPSPMSDADTTWARVLFSSPRHLAMLPVFLLRHALVPIREVDEARYPPLDIRLTLSEQRNGQRALNALLHRRRASNRRAITIGIFANASGAKRFDESWWLRFLSPLINTHPEYTIIEFVAADACSRLGGHFSTYYSSDVRKLASVVSNLTCFISGDCGVMHLACASGVPTIGLFSVTDASMYEPYGRHNQSLTTVSKMPEQVGQAAVRMIETVVFDDASAGKFAKPAGISALQISDSADSMQSGISNRPVHAL
jgi:ADP-heptose:LPS heptosyltransferase